MKLKKVKPARKQGSGQMANKTDEDLRQVMAEEGSRGRRHPLRTVTLERERRIKRAAAMLANRECEKRDYLSLLREDFELQDGSPEFQDFVTAWTSYRGKS